VKKIMISLVALALASAAHAQVTNGGFETTTGGSTGQLNYNGFSATDWSAPGDKNNYDFIFSSATAATTGAKGFDGNVTLWAATASPNGGNFLGSDPDYNPSNTHSATGGVGGAVFQTINGLTIGDTYAVTFYQAGAQQHGFSGITTESWQVSLGAQTKDSPTLTNASEGFTGWSSDTLDFTATSTSEVLSFLAEGTGGSGEPPFALLDGVSLTQVPEPATWTMMLVGFGALGTAVRSRRKQALATA
jgi:hypothetical protein